eukprot:7381224-Pyramimonas_sp.AAC.1
MCRPGALWLDGLHVARRGGTVYCTQATRERTGDKRSAPALGCRTSSVVGLPASSLAIPDK